MSQPDEDLPQKQKQPSPKPNIKVGSNTTDHSPIHDRHDEHSIADSWTIDELLTDPFVGFPSDDWRS